MTATGAGAENGLMPVRPLDAAASPAAAPAAAGAPTAAAAPAGTGPDEVTTADVGTAGSVVRAFVALVASIAFSVVALLLVSHGIRTDEFPPFLADTSQTPITRYSGPWITAGAGAVLLAVLFLLFAVVDVVRWSRSRSGGTAT